ncbi:MAG: YicC family protein [Rhodobacteraceae bacterium]|nr:YicC family protein [Paracoccaceae bacterium]
MTGFASRTSQARVGDIPVELEWELRSVNGRGLDLRLRLPDTLGFMEPALRAQLGERIARGNLSLALKLRHAGAAPLGQVDRTALEAALDALNIVAEQAQAQGVALQPPSALDLLGWRAIMPMTQDFAALDRNALSGAVLAGFASLVDDFVAMRAREGQSLAALIGAQLDEVVRLTAAARAILPDRAEAMAEHLRKALEHLRDPVQLDPARLEQEVALIAVKGDVTEELDRLKAHCAAARDLLGTDGPVGRKLDFLMQEFNREANTLCSKAQHIALTRIGLDLKTVIDQMREQVQNLE